MKSGSIITKTAIAITSVVEKNSFFFEWLHEICICKLVNTAHRFGITLWFPEIEPDFQLALFVIATSWY